MSESIYHSRPIAIQLIPKRPVHVPNNIILIDTTLAKLSGSGDNIIAVGVLLTQKANAANLMKMQEAMSGGAADRTEQRNIAYGVCFEDHKANMMLVQIAANLLPDLNDAAALIKRNGYEIKKEHAPLTSALISIKVKPNSAGTIIAEVKAPKTRKHYSIDWEYSYDNGLTWHHLHSTGICYRTISGLEQLRRITVRACYIIGDGNPTDWMVSNSVNL
jgi:hypothetical protein